MQKKKPKRLTEETRLKTEEESRRRAEVEARLKEEETRLQAEQEARLAAEAEAQRIADEGRARAEEEARLRTEAERLKEEQARAQAEIDSQREAEIASPVESGAMELSWVETAADRDDQTADALPVLDEPVSQDVPLPSAPEVRTPAKAIDVLFAEKGIASAQDDAGIPMEILNRLGSPEPAEREAGLMEVVQIGGEDAFRCISKAFDDQVVEVRNAAARALFALQPDRAADIYSRTARRDARATPQDRPGIGRLRYRRRRGGQLNRREPGENLRRIFVTVPDGQGW